MNQKFGREGRNCNGEFNYDDASSLDIPMRQTRRRLFLLRVPDKI
jgi:hypothetical protein